ncbi:YrbL family protein [Reinekea marinisedimentorum]|uniref:PhoP regulatory network protein YrbL n=1 Tax=Reinekea marinisedimentorum TaxID=230495 RepID=A0A4R3I1I7_9GAMM|nr:YrbL family protein [Reinekea marinisedimentorum]TCS38873.1 PhoP regulatory network protein YrbL [Reinekea marinisedimentorum]
MHHTFLQLQPHKPIAVGKTRYIYEFPGKPELLVKVHRPVSAPAGASRFKQWFASAEDRFIYKTGYLRELNIYLDSRYGKQDPMVQHIAPIGGFVDTDMGIGLVVSAVRDKDGNLAPTLNELIKQKRMNPARIEKVKTVLEKIDQSDLVLGDLNAGNLVLEQTEDGNEDFYLIDGLGERTFIPIQSFSNWVRKKRKHDFVIKMLNRLKKLEQTVH